MITKPSIPLETDKEKQPKQAAQPVQQASDGFIIIGWAQPLVDFLKHNILPHDNAKVDRVFIQAKSYVMVDDELHK